MSYDSPAEEWHIDLAARYSRSVGPLDLGVSVFDGTSREPSFIPTIRGAALTLVPHYAQIRQYGLDAQLTIEAWLIKLEAIRREGARNRPDMRNPLGKEEDFAAFAAGVEYTFYTVFESNADISLLGEWSYDERERRSTNRYQNDAFVAGRLALNDVESTEFVASLIADIDYETYLLGFEARRDLSDRWTAKVEGAVMLDVDREDLIYDTRRDGYIVLNLTYIF